MNTVLCLVSVEEKRRQRRFGLCELMNPDRKKSSLMFMELFSKTTRHKVETNDAPVVQVQVHLCLQLCWNTPLSFQ